MFTAQHRSPGTKTRDKERPRRTTEARRRFERDCSDEEADRIARAIMDRCNAVESLTRRQKRGIARLAARWVRRRRAHVHRSHAHAARATHEELDALFGRRWRPWKDAEPLGLFEHLPDDSGRRLCAGYRVMPWVRDAVSAALVSPAIVVDAKCNKPVKRRGRPPSSGIVARTRSNSRVPSWSGAQLRASVAIDVAALRALSAGMAKRDERLRLGDNPKHAARNERVRDRRAHRRVVVHDLLVAAEANDGFVEHRYHVSESGRLYVRGLSLQNAPSSVRRVALRAGFEYDARCCHWALLAQLCRPKFTAHALERYVTNRTTVRRRIARAAGCSVNVVKRALTAMLYGARVSPTRGAIARCFVDAATAARFISHPDVVAIRGDLGRARRLLLAAVQGGAGLTLPQVQVQPHRIVNAMGRAFDLTDASGRRGQLRRSARRRILAHLLQGYEAFTLRAVVDRYGESLLLLQHDGFTADRMLPLASLQEAVRTATGFEMAFEGPDVGVLGRATVPKFDVQKALQK